ncbi:hypothetical protein ACFLQJ_02340 [Calditrichota bacterium]
MRKIVDGSREFHKKLNKAPRTVDEIKTAGFLVMNQAVLLEWDIWMLYSEILIAESNEKSGKNEGRVFIYSFYKDEFYDLGYPFAYTTQSHQSFILYWAERISHDERLPGEKLDFNLITEYK